MHRYPQVSSNPGPHPPHFRLRLSGMPSQQAARSVSACTSARICNSHSWRSVSPSGQFEVAGSPSLYTRGPDRPACFLTAFPTAPSVSEGVPSAAEPSQRRLRRSLPASPVCTRLHAACIRTTPARSLCIVAGMLDGSTGRRSLSPTAAGCSIPTLTDLMWGGLRQQAHRSISTHLLHFKCPPAWNIWGCDCAALQPADEPMKRTKTCGVSRSAQPRAPQNVAIFLPGSTVTLGSMQTTASGPAAAKSRFAARLPAPACTCRAMLACRWPNCSCM